MEDEASWRCVFVGLPAVLRLAWRLPGYCGSRREEVLDGTLFILGCVRAKLVISWEPGIPYDRLLVISIGAIGRFAPLRVVKTLPPHPLGVESGPLQVFQFGKWFREYLAIYLASILIGSTNCKAEWNGASRTTLIQRRGKAMTRQRRGIRPTGKSTCAIAHPLRRVVVSIRSRRPPQPTVCSYTRRRLFLVFVLDSIKMAPI